MKEFLRPTKGKVIAFAIMLSLVVAYAIFSASCPAYYPSGLQQEIAYGPRGTGSSFSACGKLPAIEPLYWLLGWPLGSVLLLLAKMGTLNGNTNLLIFLKLMLRGLMLVGGLALNLLYLYAISTAALKLLGRLRKH